MKRILLLIVISVFTFSIGFTQNVNGLLFDATNSSTRNQSAAFEINANTNTPGSPLYGGFLMPRVSLTGTTDATTISGAEATSLLVYNTASVSDVTPGFYYWESGAWKRIISGNSTFPTGSGTPNYLARWITGTTLGIGATYDNGTNVGIGNTAPGHQLSVGVATSDGQAVTIRGYSNTPGSWKGGGAFGYTSAAVIMGELGGIAQLGGHNGTLGAWADLAINSGGGNVGIGSNAPTGKLDVNGGASVLSNAYLDINRDSYQRSGISWYSQSYPSWSTYMSPGTQTSTGPHGDLTAPAGTFVTSWALRNYIENAGGYGWTFESAANTTTPAVKFEIRSSDGLFHSYGNGIVDGNVGIGSNSPVERLDIAGNGRATGIMYWGNSGTRTETRDDAGTMGGRSGYYETSVPAPAANWYTGASSWQHLLEVRHSNTGNNYAMQIAGSFFDQDFWVRKTNNSATTAWAKMLTTANISTNAIQNQYTAAQSASFWINGNAQVGSNFTNLGGRLLTSNQGGWQADGVTPQMVISASTANTNRAALIGLNLHNDGTTVNTYSPFITFSRRSNSTSYNSAFAAIGAQATGQGTDANWVAGDLMFATENGTINGLTEKMRLTSEGNLGIGSTGPTQKLDVAGNVTSHVFYDRDNTGYYANPAGYSNFNQLNISRDGAGECCSGGVYTLSLAESTSGTGRMAGIQFHNGGVSEGFLRLANGGARRIQLGDYQSVGMGLEMTGDFVNQNVEWNQATSSNYTVGANSGQHVINNSTVTLSKTSGNATNNGYSVVLLVANVTASGNDITWADGVGGYQNVQFLGHGIAGFKVYLQRSTDNANWTTLLAGATIVGMQVGDFYLQSQGIPTMSGVHGDAFKFSNNVSLNYIDNVGAGTYYYRLLFETTGYNKSGGNYLISDRALSVVEIKR